MEFIFITVILRAQSLLVITLKIFFTTLRHNSEIELKKQITNPLLQLIILNSSLYNSKVDITSYTSGNFENSTFNDSKIYLEGHVVQKAFDIRNCRFIIFSFVTLSHGNFKIIKCRFEDLRRVRNFQLEDVYQRLGSARAQIKNVLNAKQG